MYINPVLTKSEERTEHYKPFTWAHYLTLRQWASEFVNENPKAIVCLVGSVLEKEIPRDVDVSIILPVTEYEHLYGDIPKDHNELHKYMTRTWHMIRPDWSSLMRILKGELWIDLKICPDVWFADRPRLVLGKGAEYEG